MKNAFSLALVVLVLFSSCANLDSDATKNSADSSKVSDAVGVAINNIPQVTTNYKHQVMILGSFHFDRSGDGSDIVAKNQIDISTPHNQQLLENITQDIVEDFKPTIIAIEWMPSNQPKFDSLYAEYQSNNWKLNKNESFQIGFRVAEKMGLSKVFCVDNRPPQPESINEIDDWDEYLKKLNQEAIYHEYDKDNKAFNEHMDKMLSELDVKQYLILNNSEAYGKRFKELSFTGLVNVGYNDTYIGADFTGNWYRRNARIFVNVRNLCQTKNERVLVIYGAAHKWALDEIFEGSPEFEVIQPFSK